MLTNYNGTSITYDAAGNPQNWRNADTIEWLENAGKQMSLFYNDDEGIYTYEYNFDGIRTKKTVYGKVGISISLTYEAEYILNGTSIIQEKRTYGDGSVVILDFLYDDSGVILGVSYNGTAYYYRKNLQGDITGIVNSSGTVVVSYTYDAWGNPVSITGSMASTLVEINPIRYRGYYYDTETGFYYLQSRYYDPVVGRFISPDSTDFLGVTGTTLSLNLFAYCENNAVNNVDEMGYAPINVIFAAIGAIIGIPFGKWIANQLGYYSGWKYYAIRAGVIIGGAVIGWFAGSLMTKLIGNYLKTNPDVIFRILKKYGVEKVYSWMNFLGINPFSLAPNASKLIAMLGFFNSKNIILGYDITLKLYKILKNFGYEIMLHSPHGGYTWHFHIIGSHGKISDIHIQITQKVWEELSKII